LDDRLTGDVVDGSADRDDAGAFAGHSSARVNARDVGLS
jgi:hypothetical protein